MYETERRSGLPWGVYTTMGPLGTALAGTLPCSLPQREKLGFLARGQRIARASLMLNRWNHVSFSSLVQLVDSSVECRDKSESRWRQIDAKRTPCDARAAFSEEICKIAVFLLAVPVQPSRCTSTLQQAVRGLLSGWLFSGGVRISPTLRRGAVRGYGCRRSIARRPGEGAFSPFSTSRRCLSRCREPSSSVAAVADQDRGKGVAS
uniref:Uncharacterized protein n=1 Tax=Ananas comosus var. bracteatus TaxID=296719 RepID=A0A6V7PRT6_ANACO|nr:unnamed protein product [Ananas comosus var. bracteatus]